MKYYFHASVKSLGYREDYRCLRKLHSFNLYQTEYKNL